MKVLVTGGTGMVGRSLQKVRPNWIYISSTEYDLTDQIDVKHMFNTVCPDAVIHLAARVGGIMDNINYPAEYFDENILMNTLVLQHAFQSKVQRFIGILSTCIYPDVAKEYPMTEYMLHDGPPTLTNFSYGYAKRSLAVQIDAYNKQYKTNYQYLIPCNLYGEFDKYGDNSHFIAALIKKIHTAGSEKNITLFGTGKPLRQFMHSDDLAYVIVKCLEENIYTNMNVATKENFSIREMAQIASRAMNASVEFTFDSTKPDGQFRKDVSIDVLTNIFSNWNPITLEDGIRKTYKYLLENNLL